MEKRVKYTQLLNGVTLTIFEKQYVDVYKIIPPEFVVKDNLT